MGETTIWNCLNRILCFLFFSFVWRRQLYYIILIFLYDFFFDLTFSLNLTFFPFVISFLLFLFWIRTRTPTFFFFLQWTRFGELLVTYWQLHCLEYSIPPHDAMQVRLCEKGTDSPGRTCMTVIEVSQKIISVRTVVNKLGQGVVSVADIDSFLIRGQRVLISVEYFGSISASDEI